jgi:hypothetical protein
MLTKTTDHDWTFDTTEDVLNFMATVTKEKHYSMNSKQDTGFNKYSWEETIEHLKHGFTTDKMFYQKEHLTKIVSEELTKLGIQYDVTGDYLDIGTYLTGQPECFAQFDYFPEDKPLLNIIINLSKVWYIDSMYVENRGIAIASLIEVLKDKYNIRCFIVDSRSYRGKNVIFRFNVNIAGFASFNQLMTYIGHTGFYRRATFTMLERMFDSRECPGQGQPTDFKDFDENKTIYFESMQNKDEIEKNYKDLDSSKKTILGIVNDLKTKQENKIFKYK